jgi:penicillin-binding protein 1A
VAAYAAFANGGIGVVPYVITQVKTATGKVIYRRPATAGLGRVIDPRALAMMTEMMRETFLIGTARKGEIPGWETAGKTGTSQDFRDAWFIGFTGTLVAGVWLGNDDGDPTKRVSGGNLPVEVWQAFMKTALRGAPPVPLPGSEPALGETPVAAGPGGRPGPGGYAAAGVPADDRGSRPEPADRGLLSRLFGL